MSFELVGKLIEIQPVIQVSDKFRKREFVVEKKETGNGNVFTDYIKFQLVQDKCDLVNENFQNREVKVSFNLKGNRWERDGKVNYFTNLDAWKIELVQQGSSQPQESVKTPGFDEIPPESDDFNDLPF
ncbi:MAG: DUF3127 domain-containing protein [Bacteroidales bacterium]